MSKKTQNKQNISEDTMETINTPVEETDVNEVSIAEAQPEEPKEEGITPESGDDSIEETTKTDDSSVTESTVPAVDEESTSNKDEEIAADSTEEKKDDVFIIGTENADGSVSINSNIMTEVDGNMVGMTMQTCTETDTECTNQIYLEVSTNTSDDKLAIINDRLSKLNIDAIVTSNKDVLIGPFQTENDAIIVRKKISAKGLKARIIVR